MRPRVQPPCGHRGFVSFSAHGTLSSLGSFMKVWRQNRARCRASFAKGRGEKVCGFLAGGKQLAPPFEGGGLGLILATMSTAWKLFGYSGWVAGGPRGSPESFASFLPSFLLLREAGD